MTTSALLNLVSRTRKSIASYEEFRRADGVAATGRLGAASVGGFLALAARGIEAPS